MPERPFTGLTAQIKINDVPLAYMSGLDLNLEKSIIEVLQFGARYQEKVPAIKNWNASVDGTVAFAPGGSQQKLYDAYEHDEEVTVGIFLNDFVYFEGKAYIGNLNITSAPDDKTNITCDFEGNGATTLTLPNTYAITANSGVGGTLTPGGTTQVAANGSHVITILPAPNYEVDTLTDNGEDKTMDVSADRYTLSNIELDHKIFVAFKKIGGADKTALRASIQFADSLTSASYEATTWATLTAALTDAKEINGDAEAKTEDVTAALDTLNEAIFGLKLKS